MKVLIASTPLAGHLNPLLSVATIPMKHNHEVVVQTTTSLRPIVEAAGAPFVPFLSEAEGVIQDFLTEVPKRNEKTPGLEMISFDMEHLFARYLPAQAAGLEVALRDFPADIILADSLFFGTLPMLLGAREKRPSIIHLGISVLNVGSGKNVPPRQGISQKKQHDEWKERELILLRPAQVAFDAALAKLGSRPLPCPSLESMSILPDLYLHPGIQGFEYPDDSPSFSPVRYIGSLTLPPGHARFRAGGMN
jgi:hypothetical protein